MCTFVIIASNLLQYFFPCIRKTEVPHFGLSYILLDVDQDRGATLWTVLYPTGCRPLFLAICSEEKLISQE